MLLAQLRTFVEIARHGTVRRASEILHVGQPALSARIAALEVSVGVELFDRGHMGMRLTPAGRALLPYAERAVANAETGLARARDVEHGRAREVLIGAAPVVSAYVLPEIIGRLRDVEPELRTLVRTAPSEEVVSLVASGESDVGLVREINDARVARYAMYQEELVPVVPPDHPLAHTRRVHVERLREAVLVLFDRNSSYYRMTHSLFRSAGVLPIGTIEVDDVETAKRMSLRGLGVAFLPSTVVADERAAGTLVTIQVDGAEHLFQRLIAVVRKGHESCVPATLWQLLGQVPDFIPGASNVGPDASLVQLKSLGLDSGKFPITPAKAVLSRKARLETSAGDVDSFEITASQPRPRVRPRRSG